MRRADRGQRSGRGAGRVSCHPALPAASRPLGVRASVGARGLVPAQEAAAQQPEQDVPQSSVMGARWPRRVRSSVIALTTPSLVPRRRASSAVEWMPPLLNICSIRPGRLCCADFRSTGSIIRLPACRLDKRASPRQARARARAAYLTQSSARSPSPVGS
jgi:hypothetical protein